MEIKDLVDNLLGLESFDPKNDHAVRLTIFFNRREDKCSFPSLCLE